MRVKFRATARLANRANTMGDVMIVSKSSDEPSTTSVLHVLQYNSTLIYGA